MKNNILNIILIVLIVMATSCSEGLFHELGWPNEDPLVMKPNVLSFSDEGVIVISWENDWATEEYILYKKRTDSLNEAVQIYRGTDLEFTDKDFPGMDGAGNILYYYSLSKIRGVREFGPSTPGLGIYSQVKEDEYEPNNAENEAVLLSTNSLTAMLYYFHDKYNNVVSDCDWYYIDLEPRQQANVVLRQIDDETGEPFNYQILNQSPLGIIKGTEFAISNTSNNNKKVYFKVFPAIDQFMGLSTLTGGSYKGYTIKIKSRTDTGLTD